MNEADKVKCWCCERTQTAKNFNQKSRKRQVHIKRNNSYVALALSPSHVLRTDKMKLCNTCKNHMINEAADAIDLAGNE